ncbi:hypothetical protein O181_003919 [Austropuccinia psidii MF-1]|uniref:Uncharacterized protein n=1 Tax=Austropuccinia psidii MF-1 TaxID=1389203 RepID=A0A9Q3BEW3_9BASI|nr:hypothetical protein [Austropuccinia psidii MF-1]
MAKRTPGPQISQDEPWTPPSTHGLWKTPGATSLGPARLSLNSGEDLSFIHGPCTKGYRRIWYNIPLCTIFAQQYNGDAFKTKICHFNSIPKSITHFEGRLFSHSVLQSLKATRRPFKDPNHLALQILGCYFI